MRIFKCKNCDRLFMLLMEGKSPEIEGHLVEVRANSKDAAVEKHVPAVKVDGNKVEVVVGEVVHPMLEEHFIGTIILKTDKMVHIKNLKAGEEPKASFVLAEDEKPVADYEYCNLHGLWVKEL